MAGNGHIIEVLHFVGAEAPFIAAQFRRHFLVIGSKGAAAGGLAACAAFVIFSWLATSNMATPQADQATALFGNFAIGVTGYAGVALIALAVTALTAATSHVTVVAYLSDIDSHNPDR
jgi:cell division transport system permease protein